VGGVAAGRRAIKLRLAALGTAALAAGYLIPGAPGASASAGSAPARPAAQSVEHVGPGGQRATIVRSAYGVPDITAGSAAGMWFGAGWAQAQDRMAQLELTRRAVEGTLSAILGPAGSARTSLSARSSTPPASCRLSTGRCPPPPGRR
jgi:acyl-homoserine lactone acylase PvdQ